MVTCLSTKCKIDFNNIDVYLSYLPMAHVLERNVFYTMIWCKGKIGLYGGDIQKIKDDLAILKPTIFVTVPRFFGKMYEIINKAF